MATGKLIILILIELFAAVHCGAQSNKDSLLSISSKISTRYINTVAEKSDKIAGKIDKQTERYLAKLEKQEEKMKRRLDKMDSLAAKRIFADARQQYQDIQNKLKTNSALVQQKAGQYFPWLDSASTSLKFLEKNPLMGNLGGQSAKLKAAAGKINELQNQLKQAASVKDFIRERKEYLKNQLQNYQLGSELKKYNQTAYYYSQQINDYRQVLNDPEKAEQKALELLNRVPVFQEFMSKNSMLAALFPAPVNMGTAQALQGLQTRDEVQQLIETQVAAGGPNTQAILQQNIASAQSALTSLKSKISNLGGGSSDLETPDFKPNTQKTKSFLKRLEYGTSIQSAKSNYYFPTTTDIALSVSYKLNEKSVLGIGASYKMGWGKDIQHVSISSQGIGFRSFFDMKLKSSFFASGGFEYNYQQPFGSIEQIKYLNAWQQSGLIGISKIVSMKTRLFKKTRLQFLWDFLSYQQKPLTQPLKFRVGYNF